jgi:carboxymethylenebutenolidase
MSLKTEWVRYGTEPFTGYFCYPERAQAPLPAVVVIQEAWGVDEHIEDVTRRFAQAGYAALAPDLFAQGGERPATLTRERLAEVQGFINPMPPAVWGDADLRAKELAKYPADAAQRIGESLGEMASRIMNASALVPALLAATSWLRDECPTTRGQKIGAVGFCMGGGLSGQLACHDPDLAAAVMFYGLLPTFDRVPEIRCPVLGLYGELDARVNAQIAPLTEAMARAGLWEGGEALAANLVSERRPAIRVVEQIHDRLPHDRRGQRRMEALLELSGAHSSALGVGGDPGSTEVGAGVELRQEAVHPEI